MHTTNATAKSSSSNSSNFHFLQFQELLSCSEEFFDNIQTINKTVKSFKNQLFLKFPQFWFFVCSCKVGCQLRFEFSKSRPKAVKDFQCYKNFIQSFFNLNLEFLS